MARKIVNKKQKVSFQDRVLNWLKSIFKAQTLSLAIGSISCLIGGLSFYFSFFYQKNEGVVLSRMDSLSINIEKNIEYIESNFNPSKIPQNVDTVYHQGLIMIREFQKRSLALGNYWKEKKDTIDVLNYLNKQEDDEISYTLRGSEIVSDYNYEANRIMELMEELDKYGFKHGINNYFINKPKWEKLNSLKKKQKEYREILWKKGTQYYYIVNSKESEKTYDEEYKLNLTKAFEIENLLKRNEVFYSFDDCLFDLIVTQNRLYEISVREFLLEYY